MRGKRAKLFEVGTEDVDGKATIVTMSTTQIHEMISSMNKDSKIIVLVIKKKAKQLSIKDKQ